MGEGASDARAMPDSESPDKLLADPKSALCAARKLGRGELKPAEREALLAAAAKLPAGPVRDLFEGYLPGDDGGPEARLEPAAADDPGAHGRCRPRREAVLVAGGQLRQLPQGRRPRHAGRAGPFEPSASCVRARICWRASWSRRAGSSRSTPPISPTPRTAGVDRPAGQARRESVVLRDAQNKRSSCRGRSSNCSRR